MNNTPSQRELFALFLPLALSGLFYPLASPVVTAALARAGPVGTGALGYLIGAAGCVWAGLLWSDIEGALLGALALFGGQIA